MDQLFLLEILVDTIFFTNPDTILTKKQINIVARFGNFANLEIRNDALGGVDESSKSADLEFSSGKSYLFPCKVNALLDALKNFPLEMTVGTRISPTPIGRTAIKWNEDFIEMVSFCEEDLGYISPVYHRDIYPMQDQSGKETGHVEVFIRLSCFGKNIQTQFQVVHTKDSKDGSPKTQFLFKSNNAATTFQCQRFGMGTSTDAIPVAPMYNTQDLDFRPLKPVFTSRDDRYDPSVFNLDQTDPYPLPRKSVYDDQMSLMGRLDDNKFINLDEFSRISASILTGSRTIVDDDPLSTENISKYLCKHRNCPAAKKFKELGIGPLATNKCLGTLYSDVEPPVVYGLSHATGTIDEYGPYGVYRRPKRPDQPFEPKQPASVDSASKRSSSCSCQKVLRLTGGGPLDDKQNMSPLRACKDLMEDFDKLLAAYKTALGPCGQAICPYAQNLIIEQCQRHCPMRPIIDQSGLQTELLQGGRNLSQSRAPGSQKLSGILAGIQNLDVDPLTGNGANQEESPDANSVSSCGMKSCPYAREMYQPVDEEMKKTQPQPACGEPSCPYTKQMLGIVDEDTDEAMRLLASHPQGCTPPPALPPIHWDCPDPLPKGRCVNSNCPINKMQDMAKKLFEARSICGGPQCPYAIPPPCKYPTCPFAAAPPCMFPSNEMKVCDDPECPLNKMSKESICKDPNCPFATQAAEECKMEGESLCEDPECPYREESATIARNGGAGDGGQQPSEFSRDDDNPIVTISGDNLSPCTPYSCMARGGNLDCDVCPCTPITESETPRGQKGKKVRGASQSAPVISKGTKGKYGSYSDKHIAQSTTSSSTDKKKKKRKRKSKFVYDTGDIYPGVKVGHRECITPSMNVPHNMGWLWNIKPVGRLKPRRGWKPGALTKTMAAIIEKHRADLGIKPLSGPPPKPAKKKMRKNAYGVYETDSEPEIPPKSTLQIKKKDGCYLITMNPLKDPNMLEDNENPYMDCTPMQFKITKNKPPIQIKPGEEDEESCNCDECDESATSDSELDIEFTPPAGIIHPDKLKRKKNVVHVDTQYNVDDAPKSETLNLKKPKKGKGKDKKGKKGGKGKKGKKK